MVIGLQVTILMDAAESIAPPDDGYPDLRRSKDTITETIRAADKITDAGMSGRRRQSSPIGGCVGG